MQQSKKFQHQIWAAWWFIVPLFLGLHIGVLSAHAGNTVAYPKIISLNGAWQRQFIDQFSLSSLKPDKWVSVQIPSMDSAGSQHFIAYRRSFENPVHASEERLLLHFNGVAFACKIFVNGAQVGEHGPTLEPFDIEVPQGKLRNDQILQELVLLIQDWTSGIENLYAGNSAKISMPSNLLQNKNITLAEFTPPSPFDPSIWYKTISPMGGSHGLLGIWDDVWLEVFHGVRLEDVAVESLVAEGKIRVTGQIQNMRAQAWGGMATIAVAEGGDSKEIVVGPIVAKQRKFFQVYLDAKGLNQWSPNRPVLYDLKVDLREVSKLQPHQAKPDPHPDPPLEGAGNMKIAPRPVEGAGMLAIINEGRAGGGLFYSKVIPFGYRSITVKDHEMFLNGRKIHLFTSSNSHKGYSPAALEEYLKSLKKLNINALRFHANIFPDWYYGLTDRFGFLVVAESALNGSYAIQNNYNSDLFFENAAVHWQGLVRKFRNHPSIIAYSIENEAVEYSHGNRAEEKFAELGRKVKAWDPTRPILFNGSDDPGGVADIISLHYPHELPFWNQYPREAWWLREAVSLPLPRHAGERENGGNSSRSDSGQYDAPKVGAIATARNEAMVNHDGMYLDSFWYQKPDQRWAWNRKKPLDIGEIGYFDGGEPIMDSILFGDDAYAQGAKVRDATQGEVWKHSIEAARALDLAMINPWNPPAGEKANAALKEALKPVKLILLPEAPMRFYGKDEGSWPAVIVNDTNNGKRLFLSYSIIDVGNNKLVFRYRLGPYLIPAGGQERIAVKFKLPSVPNIHQYKVKMEVVEEDHKGKIVLHDDVLQLISVYPDARRLPWANLKIFDLFDPSGKMEGLLKNIGAPFRKVDHISLESETLVVGPDSLGLMDRQEMRLLKQRLSTPQQATLILEQKSYPSGFQDGLTLNGRHGTTLGFIAAPHHEIFSNMGGKDLQLWAGDLVVSKNDFNLPMGGYRPLAISGGTGGLIYSPLIERPLAGGSVIFSQLAIVEKFREEPAAAQLLYNMLKYVTSFYGSQQSQRSMKMNDQGILYRGENSKARAGDRFSVVDVEMPAPFKDRLREWGIVLRLQPKLPGHSVRVIRAIDLAHRQQEIAGMISWVEKGNTLWVTGLQPEWSQKLTALTSDLKMTPLDKQQLPVKFIHAKTPGGYAMTDGLLNQFLYWTEPYPILTYQFAPMVLPTSWALAFVEDLQHKEIEGASRWHSLTSPALMMTRNVGKGMIVVDTIDWDQAMAMQPVESGRIYECRENRERAVRLFCGLLTNLGVILEATPGFQIGGEDMAVKTPGQPIIRNREHNNWWIFKNNYIAQEFDQDLSKATAIEVRARNRLQIDTPPIMRVVLNGRILGEYAVKEPVWHLYRFDLSSFDLSGRNPVPKQNVKNRLEIHLVNNPDDAYNLRYLNVDWVRLVMGL